MFLEQKQHLNQLNHTVSDLCSENVPSRLPYFPCLVRGRYPYKISENKSFDSSNMRQKECFMLGACIYFTKPQSTLTLTNILTALSLSFSFNGCESFFVTSRKSTFLKICMNLEIGLCKLLTTFLFQDSRWRVSG